MIAGVLNQATINIENNNFEIKQDEVKSQYVKNIDGNTINLNTITHGKDIEIEIPVKFPENDDINVEQFNKETLITMNGTYTDKNGRKAEINGQIRTRLMWTEEVNISVNQDIEKYIALNEKQTLLQQKIEVQVEDNKIPFQSENLEINAPVITIFQMKKIK